MSERTALNIDITEKLKMDFKIWCVLHHKSMRETLEMLIMKFLAEQKEREKQNE